MADAVNTDVLFSGNNKYIARFTNNSDGTGESGVTKIDRSSLTGPDGTEAGKIVIEEIQYDVQGFENVEIYWVDSGGNEPLAILAGQGIKEYKRFGGLVPAVAGSGTDGDIIFTTVGTPAATDSYDITLICRLKD